MYQLSAITIGAILDGLCNWVFLIFDWRLIVFCSLAQLSTIPLDLIRSIHQCKIMRHRLHYYHIYALAMLCTNDKKCSLS
jgi:hypothetical protein